MTTTTVANRLSLELQDATKLYLIYDVDHSRVTAQGDRVMEGVRLIDNGDAVLVTYMGEIVVDGHLSRFGSGYARAAMSLKDDESGCTPDYEGFCSCVPRDYHPLSYISGEICERCWVVQGTLRGIGKDGCYHK